MSAPSPPPWYREPLVWLVIGIPATSVVLGLTMLVVSIRGYDGLVVDDYYKRGMQINMQIERDRAAAERGLSAQIRLREGEVLLRLDARPRFEAPATLTLGLYHATRGGLDQLLTLARDADGLYRASFAPLAPGAWNLQLETEAWRLVGRLPSARTPALQMAPAQPDTRG